MEKQRRIPEVGNLAWAVVLWPEKTPRYWMQRRRGCEPIVRLFQARANAEAQAEGELGAMKIPFRVVRVLIRVQRVHS